MHPTAKRTFRISEGDRVRGRTRSPFKDYSSYNPYAHNDFDEKYQTKLEEILEKHAKEQERIIRRMQENSNRRR